MKKLLIVAAASGALIGCANLPSLPTFGKNKADATSTEQPIKIIQTKTATTKPIEINLTARYTCEKGATIFATYKPKQALAELLVNAPSWKINSETIVMTGAVSGSGERFINNTNPDSLYEWHTKGHDGVLSVTIAKKTYTLNCTGFGRSKS